MKIVAISGSMRPESNTRRAAEIVLQGAHNHGAATYLYDLALVPLPLFDARDNELTYPPEVEQFRTLAASADAFILISPEYHGSLTGALKNALDFLTWDHTAGKVFALVGISGGRMGANNTLNAMRTVCTWMQGWVLPLQVLCSNRDFQADGSLVDPDIESRLLRLGRELVVSTSRISQMPIELTRTAPVVHSDADE